MMLPHIVLHPTKRYGDHGRRAWGAQRTDGARGRTRALFDRLGIRKRPNDVRVGLSDVGNAALVARAAELRVCPSGLAAYLIERGLREAAS